MRGPRLAAEAIGVFGLVFLGAGAASVNAWSNGAVSHTGVALAFGGIILVAVYALGHVSGAHLNPAVTVGFWIARRFPGREVAPYIVAQLAGATAGAFALRTAVGSFAVFATTRPAIPVLSALGVEIILSFFLMLVVMAVATDARVSGEVAGLAVGFIVMVDALMGGPLTGASMNRRARLAPRSLPGNGRLTGSTGSARSSAWQSRCQPTNTFAADSSHDHRVANTAA